ncbi:MAG: radical SAM protein [Candidatus Omnitrophota bacterium]
MGNIIPASLEAKVKKRAIPLFCNFALTWRCNHRCIHCHPYLPRSKELSTQEIKDALGQLDALGCFFLTFTGGEPLLRPDFLEIAKVAKKFSFALFLHTNGSLVTHELARKIKELGFVQVQVNLLGASAKIHDRIAGVRGSFKKAINTIEYLKREGVAVILKTVLMKVNFSEFKKIIKLATNLGVKWLITPAVFSVVDKMPVGLGLNEKQIKKLQSHISHLEPGSLGPHIRFKGKTWRSSVDNQLFHPAPVALYNLKESLYLNISNGKLKEY